MNRRRLSAIVLESMIVVLLLTLLISGIFNPVGATPSRFEIEAVPLSMSAPISNVTSIHTFKGDNLLVTTQPGNIYLVERPEVLTGTWNVSLFLSLAADVTYYSESGLFDIELDPFYPSTPYMYFSFVNLDRELIIDRYNTTTSEHSTIITIPPPPDVEAPFYHHGGDIAFYDGLLYFTIGDRYFPYPYEPGHPSQYLDTLLGKIIRIDVTTGNPMTYTVPSDNPYMGQPNALPEIWVHGFRNPWKMTFDSTTGDMWIADVGNKQWEEVNYLPAGESALNFGWRCYEGNDPFIYQDPLCASIVQTPPLHVYGHGTFNERTQCAITGGLVYRQKLYPNLEGMYLYADFCASRVWGLRAENGEWIHYHLIDLPEDTLPTAFTTDGEGNIYIGGMGGIYRLEDSTPPGSTPIPTKILNTHHLYLPIIQRH